MTEHEDRMPDDALPDDTESGRAKLPLSRDDAKSLSSESLPLAGRRVAFVGSLAGMPRRDAQRIAREKGAIVSEKVWSKVNLIVVGEKELPIYDDAETEAEDWLSDTIRELFESGTLEIVNETRFWEMIGMLPGEKTGNQSGDLSRLYTPAMLADILKVPIGIVRRWHRLGLIVPVRQIRKLPYFDYHEVATARRLAQLLFSGMDPRTLERRLERLARYLPEVDRPLAQLSVIIQGRNILLRQGEGLVEPTGQRLFDFEGAERRGADEPGGEKSANDEADAKTPCTEAQSINTPDADAHPLSDQERQMAGRRRSEPSGLASILSMSLRNDGVIQNEQADAELSPTDPVALRHMAVELEDDGQLAAAADLLRASMAAGGPEPQTCFHLAELLYRLGDLSAARERYLMTLELDEDFVEARANLGCLLAEQGERELAIAALQGALVSHDDYGDVHWHLAHLLDESGENDQALTHYRRFVELCPDSPLVEQVRARVATD